MSFTAYGTPSKGDRGDLLWYLHQAVVGAAHQDVFHIKQKGMPLTVGCGAISMPTVRVLSSVLLAKCMLLSTGEKH